MKLLVIILTISSFLAKDVASFSWQTWFYVNQSEIAKEKCENKAVPMMHCNGKCYLSKQLKKLEEKEQSHNSKRNPFQKIEKVELAQNVALMLFNKEFKAFEKSHFYSYQETFSKKYLKEIFHPPTC